MNKNELIKNVSEKTNLKIVDTERVVNGLIETVSEELKKQGKVTLVGFGTFSVAQRKERMGVNPKTGEKIKIKATKVPRFSAGKALKEKVK